MILRWTDGALSDLDTIGAYLEQESDSAAIQVLESLLAATEGLLKFPRMGRVGRVAGTRERIVPPYIIQYEIQREEVWVLGVIHGARQWLD